MARYVAVVEYQDDEYWISFPGIEKTYAIARRPEDIVQQARKFLEDEMQARASSRAVFDDDRAGDATLPPSLDDAMTDPREPFEGTRLVVFEWEPDEGGEK
jgi:hypothetical protein